VGEMKGVARWCKQPLGPHRLSQTLKKPNPFLFLWI
jgi:hypothetical protein